MKSRYGCYESPSGRWFVVDRDADHVVFESLVEASARQCCIDLHRKRGSEPVAPTLRCVACWDKGFVRDPDGGASEPCYCHMPAAEARQANDDRLDYMREMRRLSAYREPLSPRR